MNKILICSYADGVKFARVLIKYYIKYLLNNVKNII